MRSFLIPKELTLTQPQGSKQLRIILRVYLLRQNIKEVTLMKEQKVGDDSGQNRLTGVGPASIETFEFSYFRLKLSF